MTYITVFGASKKTWIKQKLDPRSWVRWMGEGLISDYADKMEILREVDDNIFEWTEDLDKLVKDMKTSLATNRLTDLAILLNTLNNKLKKVLVEGKKIEDVTEKALREYESENTLEIPEELRTQAGLWDDFKRKWFSSRLELKNRKERNKALKEIISDADKTVQAVKLILSNMTSARVSGHIGKYIDEMKKIEKLQFNFQNKFLNIFQKYLKSFVENSINKEQENTPPVENPPEAVNQTEEAEIPVTFDEIPSEDVEIPITFDEMPEETKLEQKNESRKKRKSSKGKPANQELISNVVDKLKNETLNKIKIEPPKNLGDKLVPEEKEVEIPDTPPAEPIDEKIEEAIEEMKKSEEKVANHQNFMTKLAQLISNNVEKEVVINHLLDYADQIELEDKTASLKLVALAEGLMDE